MSRLCSQVGLPVGEEVVDTEEKLARVGTQARLERVLGVPQRHHLALLSMQL